MPTQTRSPAAGLTALLVVALAGVVIVWAHPKINGYDLFKDDPEYDTASISVTRVNKNNKVTVQYQLDGNMPSPIIEVTELNWNKILFVTNGSHIWVETRQQRPYQLVDSFIHYNDHTIAHGLNERGTKRIDAWIRKP